MRTVMSEPRHPNVDRRDLLRVLAFGAAVEFGPDVLDDRVGFRKILVVGSFALARAGSCGVVLKLSNRFFGALAGARFFFGFRPRLLGIRVTSGLVRSAISAYA